MPEREYGGRAIASLFPPEVRRKIDAEWVVAWLAGKAAPATGVRLASDEAHLEALREEAAKIEVGSSTLIKVSPPRASGQRVTQPRTLKDSIGIISGVMVAVGSSPMVSNTNRPHLSSAPPAGGSGGSGGGASVDSRPRAFDTSDVEQAGWDVVTHVLNRAEGGDLVDFRRRHGVGADGAFDWKRFVELKATAGGPPSTIEMSQAEYERAREAGMDYILAIVSGLETGQTSQVRLIFDPVHRASHRPTSGIRFHSLSDAPSIVVCFNEEHPISGSTLLNVVQTERGHTDEEIRKMTPIEAHKLLGVSTPST